MLFTDDIVLVAKTNDLNERLEEWQVALEHKGLKISPSNTGYLNYNFNGLATRMTHKLVLKDTESHK